MNELISLVPTFLAVVGVLAFFTSIVIQVIKKLPVLDKLPTDAVVFCVSILLTVLAFFCWASYVGHFVFWYEVVGAVIGGFVVAFVSMFGWEKFYELWQRFSDNKK